MKPLAIVAAGASFVGAVVVGFGAGIYAARQTGSSGWALVGILAGLLVGAAGVALQFRRALRSP